MDGKQASEIEAELRAELREVSQRHMWAAMLFCTAIGTIVGAVIALVVRDLWVVGLVLWLAFVVVVQAVMIRGKASERIDEIMIELVGRRERP